MSNPEQGRGDTRAQYSPEVMDLIKKATTEMSATDETKKVQFGHEPEGGSVWLARNPEDIIDPDKIVVGEETIYFGLFKKEKPD